MREQRREADCEQKAHRRSEPGRDRLRSEAVRQRDRHEHHREGPDERDRGSGVTVENRRDHELDDEDDARCEPDERAETVNPARDEQEDDEDERELEHCDAPVEIAERVPRQMYLQCGSFRRRRSPEDADPVAGREIEAARPRDLEPCRRSLAAAAENSCEYLATAPVARDGATDASGRSPHRGRDGVASIKRDQPAARPCPRAPPRLATTNAPAVRTIAPPGARSA